MLECPVRVTVVVGNLTRTDNKNVGWTQRAKSLPDFGPAGGLKGGVNPGREEKYKWPN